MLQKKSEFQISQGSAQWNWKKSRKHRNHASHKNYENVKDTLPGVQCRIL